MLTQEQAVERSKRLVESTTMVRMRDASWWLLAALYDHGPQWGYRDSDAAGLGSQVRYLQNIVDGRRSDIRITMDLIHAQVDFQEAMLAVQRWNFAHQGMGGTAANQTVANAADVFMPRHLTNIGIDTVYSDMSRARCLFGTAYLRFTLQTLAKPEGGPATRMVGLDRCMPWEIIRDPSAQSVHPGFDDEIIIHEKPRTAEWLKSNFGVELESKSTIGELLTTQDRLSSLRGFGRYDLRSQSKQPGVIVRETYFRDGSMGAMNRPESWAWLLITYTDPANSKETDNVPVYFGPNPFYGCPIFQFNYDVVANASIGRGVPHLLISTQDLNNIGWSWLARMMQAGAGQLIYEKGTIESGRESEILTNRIDKPIGWTRVNPQSSAPSRMQAPQLNPGMQQIIAEMPGWVDRQLNVNEVQRGAASKRGESGAALETRLGAADITGEKKRRADVQTLEKMLYALTVSTIRHLNVGQIQEVLGGDVSEQLALVIKRTDPAKTLVSVSISPSAIRVRTPESVEARYTNFVTAQVMDPETAQWEMMMAGEPVNSEMDAAYRKQMAEISMLIDGQDVLADMDDRHAYHRRAITQYVNSTVWWTVPDDAKERIIAHSNAHMQAMVAQAQGQRALMQPQTPQQPSPARATEAAASMAPTPAGVGSPV